MKPLRIHGFRAPASDDEQTMLIAGPCELIDHSPVVPYGERITTPGGMGLKLEGGSFAHLHWQMSTGARSWRLDCNCWCVTHVTTKVRVPADGPLVAF